MLLILGAPMITNTFGDVANLARQGRDECITGLLEFSTDFA